MKRKMVPTVYFDLLLTSLLFLSASAGDKTTEVITATTKVGIWRMVVSVTVISSIGKSVTVVASIQQPWVGLRRSVGISLSSRLPLLPTVVAIVMAKTIVSIMTSIGIGSVAVSKVAVAMGPIAIGAVEHPGIRLGVSFSLGLSSGLPLLPGLLHGGLLSGGGCNCGRDDSEGNNTTVGARHHGTGFVLTSGSGGVDERCVRVGERSTVGVGQVPGGVGEGRVRLSFGAHRGDRGNE